MVYGVPRSKLPYNIPEIKEAIIEVALDSLDEPEFIEQLRSGYMTLATFIDDEAAHSYEKARLAMAAALEKGSGPADMVRATEGFTTAAKAQDAILEEMKMNKTVFNEVVGKLKVKIN